MLTLVKTKLTSSFEGLQSIRHHNKLATTESQIATGGVDLNVMCRLSYKTYISRKLWCRGIFTQVLLYSNWL